MTNADARKMSNFERYRLVIGGWFFFAGTGGLDFASVLFVHGMSPVTPEVYGPWVYAIPAIAWVAAQTLIAVVGLAAVILRWRYVAFWAGITLALYFAFLAAAGGLAGADGQVLLRNCRSFIGPFTLLMAGLCWGRGNG